MLKRLITFLLLVPLLGVPFQYNRIDNEAAEAVAKGGFYVPKITFETEVTEDSVSTTVDLIQKANDAGAKEIVIQFDTPGGSVLAGWRLARAIESSKAPVVCIVDGMAASMGFYLLQSCNTRIMTKRAVLMAHEPSLKSEGGKEGDFLKAANLLAKLNKAMAEHIAGRMGMPVAAYMTKIKDTEWWMTWDEAKAVHAVDLVVNRPDDVIRPLREHLKLPAGV